MDETSPLQLPPAKTEADASDPLLGRCLGEFHLLRRLGQGGMGNVYLARQQSLKRQVAVKVLRSDLAANATALARFQAEAEAAARLSHANIVQVYAFGEQDGIHYIAMEYIEGRNLREILHRKGTLDLPMSLSIMRQVASALQRAGELGLVHRDIKPENILVSRKGEAKVADFGLSRCLSQEGQPLSLTASGVTMGTPLYMSPEQVQGQSVDPRSDIYSFGVTCYHLLAGKPPFTGQSAFEVALQHVQGVPQPLINLRPDLPAELCSIVHKMMAKKPEDRYQSAQEVLRDLTRLRQSLSTLVSNSRLALIAGSDASKMAGGDASKTAESDASKTKTAEPVTTTELPPQKSAPIRWLWRSAFLVLSLSAGVLLHWAMSSSSPMASVELPDSAKTAMPVVEPPPPILNSAQRKKNLQAKLMDDSLAAKAVLDALAELILLEIEERRFEEAAALYKDVRKYPAIRDLKFPPPLLASYWLRAVGDGILLAYKDDDWKGSIDSFQKLWQPPPGGFRDKFRFPPRAVEDFLSSSPKLRKAIADALERNAKNMALQKPPVPFPANLEPLRSYLPPKPAS